MEQALSFIQHGLFGLESNKMITVIDTETTGLLPEQHEIIDFAAIILEPQRDGSNKIIKRYKFKIKPKHLETAQAAALKINGYTDFAWRRAKTIEHHLPTIKKIIEESETLLGQNLLFDIKFIESAFLKEGQEPPKFPKYIDTKKMATVLLNEGMIKSTSMDSMCKHFQINFNGKAHTAIVDCERTISVWERLSKFTDSVAHEYLPNIQK
jgi:DNA polymerase-3 subunit epsilon